MEKRMITFSGLRNACLYRAGRNCIHEKNKTVKPFRFGKCNSKACPLWRRLSKPNAALNPPGECSETR